MTTTNQSQASNFSVFLLGAILNILAGVDYVSLVDYSLKAIIGGAIWLGFKMAGEHFTIRIQNKKDNETQQ